MTDSVRVVLPAHLRAMAKVQGEVRVDVPGEVTQRAVLDALEADFPMLLRHDPRPRDREAPRLRALLRLRGGPVPRGARHAAAGAGRHGEEPFMVVGAMAGG